MAHTGFTTRFVVGLTGLVLALAAACAGGQVSVSQAPQQPAPAA